MLISAWLTAVRNRFQSQSRPTRRRGAPTKKSAALEENLETRALLAAPTLVAVRPNIGAFLEPGDVRNVAPKELTLQFNPGQMIDSSNNRLFVNSPIVVQGSGQDGTFGDGNEVPVTLGYVGLGASVEEVVIRFAENLSDDYYRITIKGTGSNPLQNTAGEEYADGTDGTFDFRLDLAAQVKAVVPMPITRGAGGGLTQARNQIVVYFNSDVLLEGAGAGSAERPEFYRLMHTRNTVENTDDATAVHLPTSVDYSAVTKSATLTFAKQINLLSGAGTYRLRIGTDETVPLPPVITTFAETFVSDFGSAGAATVTIEPIVSVDGNPITLNFTKAARATNGVPVISVSGRTISVELDTVGGTTPGQLFWSFNLHPQASDLVRTTIVGNQNFNIAATATASVFTFSDPGSSFNNNYDLGTLTDQSRVVQGQIRSLDYPFDFPGNSDEPGHREIDVSLENHLEVPPDTDPQITTLYYNFQKNYGFSPQGVALSNLITENQKQRVREIFGLYADRLGVQFVESANLGFTIVTGDLRAIDPNILTGAGGVTGQSSRALNLAIMDNAETWDDSFGGSYFTTAMHEIGHLLGMGHAYDLPDLTVMGGFEGPTVQTTAAEPDFPGDADIVHGRVLFRPESRDIDLYRFQLTEAGSFSAQTVAERLSDSSLLDSVLRLYRQNTDGSKELISQNDDYFSEDSLLSLNLEAGTYFIGISASGNDAYDPRIADSGMNGTTQGKYELRLIFRPNADSAIVDTTGQRLDGDLDGVAGGEFNFWFRAVPASGQLVVDKLAAPGGNGSLTTPFREIDLAFAAAQPGQVVRIVGNGGADLNVATRGDNVAYQIGVDDDGRPLVDGISMDIPRNVVVMIDAGALLKFQDAYLSAGSSSVTVDRSGATLQVLGTPSSEVVFTSWRDETVGQDTSPTPTTPNQGNWGGLIFRHDVDNDENRLNYERLGIFMDYVAYANISYGGGKLEVDSVEQIINPITLIEARPGIYNNFITLSEDSAISADPDSFEETTFTAPAFQAVPFTPDFSRVGPDIHGNRLIDNSTNGLFVRIQTAPGSPTKQMTVAGRFNDSDIVHVITQNLQIQGTPGGPFLEVNAPPVVLVTLDVEAGGTLTAGTYNYKLVFTDASGNQSPASAATRTVTVAAVNSSVALANLPPASTPYNGRLLYRSQPGGAGPYDLIGVLNASSTTFVDNGTTLTGILNESLTGRNRARLDASLVIDPDVIVKLESSRIEVGQSAQIVAEGLAGRGIVFTSRLDDRYGAGGTFDTNNDDRLSTEASPSRLNNVGLWGGIYLAPGSTGSIDQSLMTFGGAVIPTDGDFAGFNTIEAHQAKLRVTNSVLEENRDGTGGSAPASRFGRTANRAGTIFSRGAQPILLNNIFRDNSGPVLTINVNALNSEFLDDYGRSRGMLGRFAGFEFNQGPLVSGNLLGRNAINGMVVRGETLTTQSVWDDTDIVHVVQTPIAVPNFHTFGGLRLNSDANASLVVKLQGANAFLTAGGKLLDIDDRIGGTLQIVGQPFFPVILTSLSDDTLGAGFDLSGLPMKDTNANGASTGTPGDWNTVSIGPFSNDRNVATYNENETTNSPSPGTNGTARKAEFLGALGKLDFRTTNADGTHTIQNSSDENLRLGFEVHGYINRPSDVDVYSFQATAGSEVWIDIDRTSFSLDSVVELITAGGSIIALSDNSHAEQSGLYPIYKSNPLTQVNPLDKSQFQSDDLYGTNPRDAGFRIILPGNVGQTGTYQVRVRSSNIDSLNPAANRADLSDPNKVFDGITTGSYQLQIRLRETDEVPGTTVTYADIRFASVGISILGQPAHSPLIGEYAEPTGNNNTSGTQQNLGNILNSDRAAISVAGRISAPNDVDFYRFSVTYDDIQQIPGQTNPNRYASVVFDVDYADGMSRGNLQAHIFDAETNQLILTSRDSNVADDRSGPLEGSDVDDLSRGSAGNLDPFIGPFELPEGNYYLAISSHDQIPQVLEQTMRAFPVSDTIRLEPITSTRRIVDEHFGGFGTGSAPLFDLFDNEQGQNLTNFHIGDIPLFVSDGSFVYTVNPYTGTVVTALGSTGVSHGEIAMRADGELFMYFATAGNDGGASTYARIDTGTGARTDLNDDGIVTYHDSDPSATFTEATSNAGTVVTAFTYFAPTTTGGFLVATRGDGRYRRNILYQFNARTGSAISQGALRPANSRATQNNVPNFFNGSGTDVVEITTLPAAGIIQAIAVGGNSIFAVDDTGVLYEFDVTGLILNQRTILDPLGFPANFTGLSIGPDEVEGGAYANTLFATDSSGVLYALYTGAGPDLDGNPTNLGDPAPMFVDGQSVIQTGLGAVGIAFGTLEYNLWSTTGNRAGDVGHGMLASPDGTRLDTPGGASLYFGNQAGGPTAGNKNDLGSLGTLNNYNFPGGSHGSFISNPISLEGYSAGDKPTLYFNYFLDTASLDYIPGVRPMTDSLRVYIGDGTTWSLTATNDSYRAPGAINDEQDFGPTAGPTQHPTTQLFLDVGELYDEQVPPRWRQARIDLSNFAGRRDLRLRFEFASSGSVNVGDITTVGEEFYARPGAELRDGQNYILEGVNQFEIETGYTLVAPSVATLGEGETFTIQGTVFEFDKAGDGPQNGGLPVVITSGMSPAEIAIAMERAIDAANITDLRTYRSNNRISLVLEPAGVPISVSVTVSQSVGAGLLLDGTPGTTPGTTSVIVHVGMDRNEVAEVVAQRLADHLLPAGVYREAELNNSLLLAQDLEALSWTDAANNTITASATLPHISVIGTSTVFTGTDYYAFTVPGGAAQRRVVVDLDGTLSSFNSIIRIVDQNGLLVTENINGGMLDVGSNHSGASFLDVNLAPGDYFVQIGVPPFVSGANPGQRYTMHLSVEGHTVNASGPTIPLVVNRFNIKSSADLVRIIGHYVTNPGPMGLTTYLPGDEFGGYYASLPSLRGVGNGFEGVYIDDIVIGLAERGEMVTGAPANTNFIPNWEVNDPNNLNPYQDILEGDYDIEIRRASDYASGSGLPNPQYRSFDSNDRMAAQQTLIVADAWDLRDGQTFTLSDGVNTVTFEYDDISYSNSVQQGHFAISFDPRAIDSAGLHTGERATIIAARIRDAINSTAVQGILTVSASLADGAANGAVFSSSNRVNIYGNAIFTLGDGLQTPSRDSNPVGISGSMAALGNTNGSNSLFQFTNTTPLLDPNTGYPERINQIRIQLPDDQNFDPISLMGGRGNGPTINAASDFVTPTFTSLDALDPRIPVFQFNNTFDLLTIDFSTLRGPGFDAGDQLIFGLDVDFGPEPIHNLSGVVEITFSSGRKVMAEFVQSPDSSNLGVLRPLSDPTSVQFFDNYGDQNRTRDQGQLLIHSNFITNSQSYGIWAAAAFRPAGGLPHAGAVRNLREPNLNRWVPGLVISNNVIAANQNTGIRISGDALSGTNDSPASVAIARIVNNTIVGFQPGGFGPTGILVDQNASPTILNNILADLDTGIWVDASSQNLGTVLGTTLYRGNRVNANTGTIGLGTFPILLNPGDPLFVDESNRNYYPAPLSKAIDSSLDGLGDRTTFVTVKAPLGLGVSPLNAPGLDVYGQVRGDDPDVVTPASQGANVFKDRGAIDRVDFFRPTAKLTDPLDGGPNDLDPAVNFVWLNLPGVVRELVVTLSDVGIGIDDNRVLLNGSQFQLFMDDGINQPGDTTGTEGPLINGTDYVFVYNSTTNEVIFRAVTSFPFERKYRIVVDNDDDTVDNDGVIGIRDLAGNYLAPNRIDGTTQFNLVVTDGVNDPPINSVPGPANQTTAEDTRLVFSAANGNAVSVSDADVWLGTNRLTLTLTATNGKLSLKTGFNPLLFAFTGGSDGIDDPVITFEGLVPDINAALDGLQFTPDQDYFGPATVTILTDDLGEFRGPPETDTDVINIDVTPVNDNPSFDPISNPAPVEEHLADLAAGITIPGFMTGQKAGPANETPPQTISAILTVQSVTGKWTPTTFFAAGPAIDTTTGDLTFRTAPDVNGTATIEVVLKDSLGLLSDPQTFVLTVTPVNDVPVFTLNPNPGALLTSNEDAGTQNVPLVSSFAAARATALDEISPPTAQTTTWVLSFATITSGNLTFDMLNIDAAGVLHYKARQDTAGTATATLILRDNGSGVAPNVNSTLPVTLTITVNQLNDAPVAVTGNYVVDEGYSITLDASASYDVDAFFGDTLTYSWDLDNNGSFETSTGASAIQTFSWSYLMGLGIAAPDVRSIKLQAKDQSNATDVATATLTTLIVDYGDAPDSYGTLKTSNGAAHTIANGLYLGATVSKEQTGQPSAAANLDTGDDGVTFPTYIEASPTLALPAYVDVTASAAGKLDVFLDLDGNGDFLGTSENLSGGVSYSVVPGLNRIYFTIPAGTTPRDTYMRFRLSSAGLLGPTGRANDGEVEDYAVKIRSLSTAVKPTINRPVDFMPADGKIPLTTDLTPTVAWSLHPENYKYDIVVRNSSSAIVFQQNGTTFNHADISPALPAGVYTATVTAYNKVNVATVAPQATWQFQVVPLAVASPIGDIGTSRPTITWNDVEGSKTYTVQIDSIANNTTVFQRTITVASTVPPNQLTVPSNLPLGQYRVRVQATDALDLAGDWSPFVNFTVRTAPVITAPTGSVTSVRPQVSWNAVTGATSYEVVLFNITDNASVSTVTGITATNWTPTADLPLAEYRASVRAFNGNGDSSFQGIQTFTVAPLPVAVTPSGRLPDSTPSFGWHPVPGADKYELIVSQAFGAGEVVISQLNLTGTAFTQPTELPVGRYSYQIRAVNTPGNGSAGASAFSSQSLVYPFTITQRPVVVNPPATTFDARPTITWANPYGSDATAKSEVWLDKKEGAATVNVFKATNVIGTSYVPPQDLVLGTYIVWVRTYSTVDPATVSDWSIQKTFRVTTAPTLIGPSGRIGDATPTLNWNGVNGGQTYRVWVTSLSLSLVAYDVSGLNALNFTIPTDLPIGRYRYWVQARSAFGDVSSWSLPKDFQVVNSPVLSGPSASTFDTTPSFSWSDLAFPLKGVPAGATSYDFRLDQVLPSGVVSNYRVANGLTTLNYTIPTDLPVGIYRAYIRARNADTQGDFSTALEFFVGGRPVVNVIGSTSNKTPTITWKQVDGAASYEIFISLAATPNTALIRQAGIGATSFTVPQPLARGQYRVWVRAVNAANNAFSLWSEGASTNLTITDASDVQNGGHDAAYTLTAIPAALASPEMMSESTISMLPSVVSGSEYVPRGLSADAAILPESVSSTTPPEEQSAVMLEATIPQTDEILSQWHEQSWWNEPVAAASDVTTERKASTVGPVGFFAALLALAPRSLRRRRKDESST